MPKLKEEDLVVSLAAGWGVCERGNTWLVNTDGDTPAHAAWFHLEKNLWLEVTVNPGNSPGFEVQVIHRTEKQMVRHVKKLIREDWYVRRCNLPGIDAI